MLGYFDATSLYYEFGRGEPKREAEGKEIVLDVPPGKKVATTRCGYNVASARPTKLLINAFNLAGKTLQKELQKINARWVRTDLTYPFVEHLTFSYKNKIFCVLIDFCRENGKISFLPERYREILINNCEKNDLVPCVFKVVADKSVCSDFRKLVPATAGWNLFDARTSEPIDPEKIASDVFVNLSPWEIFDWGVSFVCQHIRENTKFKICDKHNVLGVFPQIWMENEQGERFWVYVSATAWPDEPDPIPAKLKEIHGFKGFYAGISFASEFKDDFVPPIRSRSATIFFQGLKPVE